MIDRSNTREQTNIRQKTSRHPWIWALFAGIASLFVYAIWFAPRDETKRDVSIGMPAERVNPSTPTQR
jgi:hypothetical protein